MRLVIVPRWAGDADSDFYPWLRETVQDSFESVVTTALAPTPGAPEIEPSVANLMPQLEGDPSDTIVLAHSAGNQVVMHALARLEGRAVAGCLMVAGWFSLDEPWDAIQPWIDAPLDDARVRAAAGTMRVLLSDNDRFTSDFRATRSAFESRFGATVQVAEGRDHFNDARQPDVVEALGSLRAGLAGEGNVDSRA